MKSKLFLLPVATSVLVVVSGCQSPPNDSSNSTQASATTAPAPAAPAIKPTPTAPAAAVQAKALPQTIRINAGGGAVKDSAGVAWLADIGFSGGDVIERPDAQVANTAFPDLYRSEHYSMDAFSQKVPNGKYQVKLHFCETYEGIGAAGDRVFSFDVEGKAFKDFDVWAKAGGGGRAYVETVTVDIADGQLDVKFTPNIENPQINGIEIIPLQ